MSRLSVEEAAARGGELLARMQCNSPENPWRLDVWENMGWHYRVVAGNLKVSPSVVSDGFFGALLGEHGGSGLWTVGGPEACCSDPNEAARVQVRSARREVNKMLAMVEHAEKVLGLEPQND